MVDHYLLLPEYHSVYFFHSYPTNRPRGPCLPAGKSLLDDSCQLVKNHQSSLSTVFLSAAQWKPYTMVAQLRHSPQSTPSSAKRRNMVTSGYKISRCFLPKCKIPGFVTAVHKPTGDVTDATSIIFTFYGWCPSHRGPANQRPVWSYWQLWVRFRCVCLYNNGGS